VGGLKTEKFDVIIVGAGPAGATAAYHLAKKGFNVLLVERGRGTGSKQVFGGRIYVAPLRKVFDDIEKAPIHRWVSREKISILNGKKSIDLEFRGDPTKSFTTYLTQFTGWIVNKATDAGCVYADEIRVDSLLKENGKFTGIIAGSDKINADVVVDAEGVNRLLLERSGIVEKADPNHLALGIKEVIKLGQEKIEERFGLSQKEGMSWVMLGDITNYMPGGAFVYTNKDSVSIGIVLHLGSAIKGLQEMAYRLVEKMRTHPILSHYWKDGDIMEYAAHLTIESAPEYMPPHFAYDGLVIVGDAAGLLLNTGLTFRGVDYAVYSGYLAANGIEKSLHDGKTDAETLREYYEEPLKQSFLYKDLQKHRGIQYAMKEPRFFNEYIKTFTDTFSTLYDLDDETPLMVEALMKSLNKNNVGLIEILLKTLRVMLNL